MTKPEDIEPAAFWPVRSFVLEELEAIGVTPEGYLLGAMGSLAYRQVMDVQKLSPRTVKKLADTFQSSEDLWQNLDDAFWKALHSGRYYLAKEE